MIKEQQFHILAAFLQKAVKIKKVEYKRRCIYCIFFEAFQVVIFWMIWRVIYKISSCSSYYSFLNNQTKYFYFDFFLRSKDYNAKVKFCQFLYPEIKGSPRPKLSPIFVFLCYKVHIYLRCLKSTLIKKRSIHWKLILPVNKFN